jgi:endoglucanase
MSKVASQPTAQWVVSGLAVNNVQVYVNAAAAAKQLPVLVAYDIPWRDCGDYSSGGAASPAAYKSFIDTMSQGIARERAVVIVEPDALAELSCLSAAQQGSYYQLLNYAAAKFKADNPHATIYLDAGNSGWQPVSVMAQRLIRAGVTKTRGFSLNVSNFDTTASSLAYGTALAKKIGGNTHFVVDTSRNGQGPAPNRAWCNPPGRGLGLPPSTNTGSVYADAFLWVKTPGASDGTCNGGPAAGVFWPQYALGLAANAANAANAAS